MIAGMIRDRSRILRALATAIALAFGASACAQGFGVATWNAAWLMDEAVHARWTAACAGVGWRTGEAIAGLPFCDVHNGMAFPPDACASDRDDWPRAARYPDDHPCRETLDLAQPARYAKKLGALRATWARLDAMGVRLVALQEVFDASAVRAIAPPQWTVATTREMAGAPVIAQHVGVAWRRGADVRALEIVAPLADSGLPDRPLRPGLAFTVDVGGKPVRVLVVHLKAGCRSRDLDAPLTARDAALDEARRDAIVSDCALLRYQLPALEAWIDAQASRDFAVIGDFNRTILREAVADSPTYRTRSDGTSAKDPLGRCTIDRQGSRVTARCDARTRAMFPELNDGHPPGAVLWRARFADQARNGAVPKGTSGDCSTRGARGDLTHDGIDHILISESLKKHLAPSAVTMRAVNYVDDAGAALRGGRDVALPSDHCPHVVDWTPLTRNDP
jgi:endonuclease/exonuclease/phosphatase family metal-dependent hydrolase